MPLNEPAGLSFAWSFHLIDTFQKCGVRHAFIAPGSRSTPLVMALAHHQGIECHSVLDERAAAYMALGTGKTSGIPALFVCTSGTAVANALPAVIESRMSASPLIVLAADRPPKMRSIGASQTIDQTKIFGDYPLFYFDAGEPVDAPDDFKRIGLLACQSFEYAGHKSGPVHINLPFRKPLEPTGEQIKKCINHYNGARKNPDFHPPCHPPVTLNSTLQSVPEILQDLIAGAERPLVAAGPDLQNHSTGCSFINWCRRHHIPVLSETGGIPGSVTHHPLILQNDEQISKLQPDLILRTGGSPVHRATLSALQSWQVPQIVFEEHPDHNDATLSATHRISSSVNCFDWDSFNPFKNQHQPGTTGRSGKEKTESKANPSSRSTADPFNTNLQSAAFETYFNEWNRRNEQSESDLRIKLDAEEVFTDGHVYRSLLPLLSSESGYQVVLSNSFAIRDYPLFGPGQCTSQFPVLVNRGASGIDGITSTAVGAALSSGKPTLLFTGDLAFLHDVTALNNLGTRNLSLKIIVINNRGGTIFRMLPFDQRDEIYHEFIETPQQVAIPDIARAHGIACETVENSVQLEEAWNRLTEYNVGILECRTDSDASMRVRTSV